MFIESHRGPGAGEAQWLDYILVNLDITFDSNSIDSFLYLEFHIQLLVKSNGFYLFIFCHLFILFHFKLRCSLPVASLALVSAISLFFLGFLHAASKIFFSRTYSHITFAQKQVVAPLPTKVNMFS